MALFPPLEVPEPNFVDSSPESSPGLVSKKKHKWFGSNNVTSWEYSIYNKPILPEMSVIDLRLENQQETESLNSPKEEELLPYTHRRRLTTLK